MIFRLAILAVLSLTLLTGCLSLARPGKQQRAEASAHAAKDLVVHRAILEKATYLVFASDEPTAFDFLSHGDQVDLKFVSPAMVSGLATGISSDGYLMTAAHVIKKHCYVVGWMDGKPAVFPARMVCKKLGGEFGEELAILHVDRHLDGPLQLGTLAAAERDVYAFACERQPEMKVIAVAGKVIVQPERKVRKNLSTMTMDLPLWKGDSGGAVLSKEGKLVGVFIGVSRSLTTFKVSRLACVPDMDWVQSIVEADRLSSAPVPEPGTLCLFASGSLLLGFHRWKKRISIFATSQKSGCCSPSLKTRAGGRSGFGPKRPARGIHNWGH